MQMSELAAGLKKKYHKRFTSSQASQEFRKCTGKTSVGKTHVSALTRRMLFYAQIQGNPVGFTSETRESPYTNKTHLHRCAHRVFFLSACS
jgi:hypothetical protein